MKVTTRFIYGLKFLEFLYNEEGPIKMMDAVKKLDISKKYLEKIAGQLHNAELISAVRGPNGGYYPAKDLVELDLFTIYTALEGPVKEGLCYDIRCRKKHCITSTILDDINSSISDMLRGMLLKDYLEGKGNEKNISG
ncbi:Rrf2 family transcriptional regulator [bacterium]|nr:Rrf2 family transcriptional regulator [bacterium]